MSPELIAAFGTAAVAIIGAVTSLIVALRSNGKSAATAAALTAHQSVGLAAGAHLDEGQKAAASAVRDRALRISCPACGAPVGQRCMMADQPTNLVHLGRMAAWSATMAAGKP